jgi:hypothetical protein
LLKRGIIGTYHNVSKKYLPLYLNEFQWRFNHRKDPDIFIAALRGCGGVRTGGRFCIMRPVRNNWSLDSCGGRGDRMPKKEDDKPVVTHPLSFEEVLTRMLKTPPVNPAKRKKKNKKRRSSS